MKLLAIILLAALLPRTDSAACADGTSVPDCSSCGGDCVAGVGCFCTTPDPNVACKMTNCLPDNNDCCSAFPNNYWDQTQQCCTSEPACYGQTCGADEKCVAVSGGGTECDCISKSSSLTIQTLKPTVDCDGTTGAIITSISKCELKTLGYDPDNIHGNDNSSICDNIYSSVINDVGMVNYQVQTTPGYCGNKVTNDSVKIYFTNTLHIYPTPGPLITKNPILYDFTCAYNLTMETSLKFALHPMASTTNITGPSGSGTFALTMALYQDNTYVNPITEDYNVNIGDPLYVGIFSPTVDAKTFVLYVDTCKAYPTKDMPDSNSVTLVTGGAPATDSDVLTHVVENGDSNEVRFDFTAFAFSSNPNSLYISCNVRLCSKTEGCKKARADSTDGSATISVPVNLNPSVTDGARHHTAAGWVVLAGSLLAYLSAKVL